ncbi:unnamed protein product, partial [Polarella glacialis]
PEPMQKPATPTSGWRSLPAAGPGGAAPAGASGGGGSWTPGGGASAGWRAPRAPHAPSAGAGGSPFGEKKYTGNLVWKPQGGGDAPATAGAD